MPPQATRKLAAIVCTDIVAYSRLMEADEDGTLERMKAHRRELWEPEIAGRGGRIVGSAGDGLMIEFASAVSAVECALAIQKAMAAREAGRPAGQRMLLRVGVNIGEVMVDGSDLLGDGVNIAARLQALATPGGICISGKVHDEIRGALAADFTHGGEHAVKNIARAVRVWRWPADGLPNGAAGANGDAGPPLPDKPSIAVLPFENMSGDPEQDYFADGICEDVITDLSKVSGLFVTARHSSFAYKGRNPDIRVVCRELGIRYVLEGSVRRAGRRVRINAQLIDGLTGGHVWADRFDRDLEDIFAAQDDVTRAIVRALEVVMTRDEKARRAARGKIDPAAYDLYIRGRGAIARITAESMAEARGYLARAIEIDPGQARFHAWMAGCHCIEFANGWNGDSKEHLAAARALADRALAIDANEPAAYQALALVDLREGDLEQARRNAELSLERDPNSAVGFASLGNVYDFLGRHEEAVAALQQAVRLDPEFSITQQFLGRALFSLGRYEAAETAYMKRLEKAPNSDFSRLFLAAIYGHGGRFEEARRLWQSVREINPDFDLARLRHILPYRDPARLEHLLDGLRAARLIE
ncbi:adenylate/guanylate cyclase domain-containing protein [Oceanibacterium hippocampi]|uniref:DNA-binding transcriptional activator CadC n=1 Tax=Oceanibacterium hippocampi TaxID=745714 RepID=A0A1Y5T4E5_9PROT|nr:adenylate/guanylate cyclase domain-containing protein [Oceanibacterium hippocampi]SLN53782.1 DNA-binding transcriptional activator CadC [Oceanibacterium hippocampi]